MAKFVRIVHLTGPLAGKTQEFGGDTRSILFGREAEGDGVAFPRSLTVVGRQHFRLIRGIDGDYSAALIRDHYVEVDGHPVEPGIPVKSGSVFRLGDKNGPTFRLDIEEDRKADDPFRTAPQRAVKSSRALLDAIRRNVAVAGIAGVVLFAVVFAGLYYVVSAEQSLADEVAEIRERAKASFSDESLKRLAGAAYVVVERKGSGDTRAERALGTAWPVGPGIFATNAHVALAVNPGESQQYFVRAPDEAGDGFAVTGTRVHPAYGPFFAFLKEQKVGDFVVGKGYKLFDPVGSYDVALLQVTGSNFPEPLPLATEEEVRSLKPGDPLAFAGYPTEGTVSESTAHIRPNPELQFGAVTTVSDFFFFRALPEMSQLVHHSIPITGGASGGPIIDVEGRVVAIVSGGNVGTIEKVDAKTDEVERKRFPSAVLINFGQRADLVTELLAGTPDVPKVTVYWQAQATKFASWDGYTSAKLEAFRQTFGGVPVEETACNNCRVKDGETKTVGPLARRTQKFPVKAGGTYGFLAHAQPNDQIALGIFADGKLAMYDDEGRNGVPNVVYEASADGEIELRVFGPADADVTYTLYQFSGG